MQRQTPVTDMLNAIEKLQNISSKRNSVSNATKFLSDFKAVRKAYSDLDNDTKAKIDTYLLENHKELHTIFQKSGSQITNIPELGRMISYELLDQLHIILKSAPAYQIESESTQTKLLRRMSSETIDAEDSGTMKVIPTIQDANNKSTRHSRGQIDIALNSPNLSKPSVAYLLQASFGSPATLRKIDPLSLIIDSFTKLLKNKEINQKQRHSLTTNYVEAYEKVICDELEALRSPNRLTTLRTLANSLTTHPELQDILTKLNETQFFDDQKKLVIAGEEIAKVISAELIQVLQEHKIQAQENHSALSFSKQVCK